MPILNETPITKPAEPEKTFPLWWITALEIGCPSPTSGVVKFTRAPASEDGEILGNQSERISTTDFWQMLSEVPEAAAAFEAVIAASPKIWAWLEAQKEEAVEP